MIVLIFGSLPCYGDLMDIYNKIKQMSMKNTPNSYRVRVNSGKFKEALQELPEDILTGNGEPYVTIQFQKGEGFKIVVENIKSEYASLFSMYEDYFKFSGISKVQNPVEFREIIDKDKLAVYKEDKDYLVVQAWDPEQEIKGDNYALFSLDKKNWVIQKAVYYLDGTPFVQVENSYKAYGKYYMPYKVVLLYLTENTSDIFLFEDYKFN
jgi:hypothetical protein